VVSINEVNLSRVRVQSPVPNILSRYVTSHPGQLSLPSFRGR